MPRRVNKAALNRRSTDGGTYLVVADHTEEAYIALQYAIILAKRDKARIAIAHIMNGQSVASTWGDVEEKMKQEMRENAEQYVSDLAKVVRDEVGMYPCIHISDGEVYSKLMEIIDDKNNNIKELVLSSTVSGSGGGNLIAHFTSKMLSRLEVPLIIVPGHLHKEEEKQDDDSKEE